MDYEVTKEFSTVNRRFSPGTGPGGTLPASEDIGRMTIESLIAKGFIREKAEMASGVAEPIAAPTPKASTSRTPAPRPDDDK